MVIKDSIKFEQDLYNLINNCGLSVDTAFYILKSVYLDFEKTLLNCANNEGAVTTTETTNYELNKEDYKNLQLTPEEKSVNEQPVD